MYRKNNRVTYLLIASVLLAVEVVIAMFVQDRFIRPYLGDFLVVIMLYCFVRALLNPSIPVALLAVLLFSYIIELLQLVNLIGFFRLSGNKIAHVVLGTSFSWFDLLAYTLGIGFSASAEALLAAKNSRKSIEK